MQGRAALLLVLCGATTGAQDSGPDTCTVGFVWREAFPGDHVCVAPAVREQAAEDNRLALQRRAPGGPYGADTCRPGFVWREARASDRVCVLPERRTQAASDNRAAPGRYARAGRIRASGRLAPVSRPTILPPNVPMSPPPRPPRSAGPVVRGFDEKGEPYIEERLTDGSVRREQQAGVMVTYPDGTTRFFPPSRVFANAQPPTPPQLPSDPTRGRNWVTSHNQQLLDLIGAIVSHDPAQMQTFSARESQVAGADLFRQVEYRTLVLRILATP